MAGGTLGSAGSGFGGIAGGGNAPPPGSGTGGYFRYKSNADARAAYWNQQGVTADVTKNTTYSGTTEDGVTVTRGTPVYSVNIRQSPGNQSWPTGGTGAAQGGNAIVAVQSQPALTGGGMGWRQQASRTQLIATAREGEFRGIDTLTPPEQLNPGLSPYLLNIEQSPKIGSRCKRRGVAKLTMDRDSLHDGSDAATTLTMVAVADLTADEDYILFRLPNGTTRAFWFDVTGSDTEPQGSQDATASTRVNVSGDTTAIQVAATLETAINGASIGLTADDSAADGTLLVEATPNGYLWRVWEFVGDAGFLAPQFVTTGGSAINSIYRGLSLAVIPASGTVTDRMLMTFETNPIGQTPGGAPTALFLVENEPRWGRPVSLKNTVGPRMALSQTGSNLRVQVNFSNLWNASNEAGVRNNSVVAVTVMFSSEGYPRDIDNKSEGPQGAYLANREPWGAASVKTFDSTGGLTAGRYFVTCWGHTREGVSEPSFRSFTIT